MLKKKDVVAVSQCLFFAALASFALVVVAAPPARSQDPLPPGACVVEDAAFTTANGGCQDNATGIVWSAARVALDGSNWLSQPYAAAYCDSLNEGGYSDWSLPPVSVLQQVAFNGAAGHLNAPYPAQYRRWTSTRFKNKYYTVRLSDGEAKAFLPSSGFDTICAR